MVKRHNKTGRRQILQLDDKKSQVPVSKVPSRVVVSRNSDSEDDSKQSPREGEQFVSSAVDKVASAVPIDCQVADFLKEIDALTVEKEGNESSEAEAKQLTEENNNNEQPEDSNISAGTTNGNIKSETATEVKPSSASVQDPVGMYCVWQEICDDSTGYSYYWNIQTNEVTWDCPPEYLEYLKFLNSSTDVSAEQSAAPSTSAKSKRVKKNKQKKKVKEGAIIPISYFGGSSSSEYSSDDDDSTSNTPDSPVYRKTTVKSKSSSSQISKTKSHKKDTSGSIGPQLPPDFQFPENVPVSPSQSNELAESKQDSESVKEVEFGPQLPPDFVPFVSESPGSSIDDQKKVSSEIEGDTTKHHTPSNTEVLNDDSNQGPQSSVNGLVVESSQENQSWEESLMDMERQFQTLSQGQNMSATNNCSEMPDSTTKKEMTPPKAQCVESSEINVAFGSRPVVAYGTDTDDDEDQELVCTTSSVPAHSVNPPENSNSLKQPDVASSLPSSVSPKTVFQDIHASNHVSPTCHSVEDNIKPESSDSLQETSSNATSDKQHCQPLSSESNVTNSSSFSNEYSAESECSYSKEPVRHNYSDIVSNMFSVAQENAGKYGFGFTKSKQLELENNAFNNFNEERTVPSKFKTRKGHYQMINFVKSEHVLDLNALSRQSCSEDSKQLSFKQAVTDGMQSQSTDLQNDGIPIKDLDLLDVPGCSSGNNENFSELKNPVHIENVQASVEKEVVKTKSETLSVINNENSIQNEPEVKKAETTKKVKKSCKKKRKGNSENLTENGSLDDIDQILNNILKEKQMADKLRSETVAETLTSQEEVKPKKHSAAEKHPVAEKHPATEIDTSIPVKKIKKEEPEVAPKNDMNDMTSSILDLSSLLVDKLTFLIANHSTMSSLTNLLIQIQIRLVDWQAGALQSKYFLDRLQEVHQYILHYEMGAVSGDWTCQWDRDHKRYFYVNRRTNHSQWTFPNEMTPMQASIAGKSVWSNHMSDISTSTASTFQSGGQYPLVSSSMSEERMHKNNASASHMYLIKQEESRKMPEQYPSTSMSWMRHTSHSQQPSPPPPPPGVDSPPPPPPKTPPPESPPPPPPDSTEVEDREIPDVDMDLEDSNSSDSLAFARSDIQSTGTVHASQIPLTQMLLECSSTRSPDDCLHMLSTNRVSSTSTSSAKSGVITKPPQPITSFCSNSDVTVSSASNGPSWLQSSSLVASCSSSSISSQHFSSVNQDVVPASGTFPSASSVTSKAPEVSKTLSSENVVPSCSSTSQPKQASTSGSSSTTGTKKEKKKPKLLAGLALKKKKIPSLVEKWQKIKQQQEKEDKVTDESKISTSM